MIAVVDYGAGNLRSITRALEANGATTEVTSDPQRVRDADRVVLPGVGNAKAAMAHLNETGIAPAIRGAVVAGKPLLGICLGMQLLFGAQEEGPTTGLAIIPGDVRRLPPDLKTPHVGWNTVTFTGHSPLAGNQPALLYFVHSYVAHPAEADDIAGITDYGLPFPAIVVHNQIWGMQCHPEKSGWSGLNLLRTWLDWTP